MILKTANICYRIMHRHVRDSSFGIRRMICGARSPNSLMDLRNEWTETLSKSGVPDAELSVRYIIEKALRQEMELSQKKEEEINEMCKQRLKRKPVQYIIGDWDFRHLTLIVKPPVFIPRPETEELVDLMQSYHQLSSINHPELFKVLEVGCGSGAICLSLLSENQQISFVAIDINPEAVSLTHLNGRRHNLQGGLTVCEADIANFRSDEKFDAIISNPPYIPSQDMGDLQTEVKSYEDEKALCGGEDGLDVIKDIFAAAPQLLKPYGSIWLEVDLSHPPRISQWIRENKSLNLEVNKFHDDFTQRSLLAVEGSDQYSCSVLSKYENTHRLEFSWRANETRR